jgi:signal transduction histidine kinase
VRGETEQRKKRGRNAGSRYPHRIAPGSPSKADVHLKVLEGICRAFASASDPDEARAATARWVREAVGSDASLRIRIRDESGELRVIFSDRRSKDEEFDRFSDASEALRTKGTVIEANASADASIANVPMISRGEIIGVLEIRASRESLMEAMPSLEAVASQAAILFRNLQRGNELDREISMRRHTISLTRELFTAPSPEAAVQTVVRFCWEQARAPSAGWLCGKDAMLMRLVTVAGMEDERAHSMTQGMASVPRWDLLTPSEQERIREQFTAIGDVEQCVTIEAGEVLVLTGALPPSLAAVVHELLRDVLDQLATVARAHRRNKQLDVALAWTAHEFRGPLAGVKALLEQEMEAEDPGARDTMERLHAEVVRLLDIVEPVLDSAVGSSHLRRQRSNLVRLTEEAVAALDQEADRKRVTVSGSSRATASVDRALFGVAIANLIRNAVTYSFPESDVIVSVRVARGRAEVSVTNRGPEIPASEHETIFDPFIRGRTSRAHSGGRGLGLFIARRIVEAHGGRIEVESSNSRTVFQINVPVQEAEVVNLLEVESGLLDGRL